MAKKEQLKPKKTKPDSQSDAGPPKEESRFHIAGIGASAGGLEVFEEFFTHLPAENGIAFVLITHLNPSHMSILPDLIKKYTRMLVYQIEDGMEVKPDCVYVTPPNKDVAILNGILQLMEPPEPRGLRLPIDYFFRSLAHDQAERAIGIIFSGSGSDGASGMKEIKAELGMTMVQDPNLAKYDSMPRSSIASGIIDYILPAEKMPEQLLKYVKHIPIPLQKDHPEEQKISSAIQKILILVRNQTGQDFSLYKKNTINRRIERRLTVHQIDTVHNYLYFLQQNPKEIDILFNELLIGVTSFFRNPEAFEIIKTNFSTHILKDKSEDYPIRVWVPGCSSGEEVYSLAIIIHECLEELNKKFNVQIFGTDIDAKAINKSRTGIYPLSIASDVKKERLSRFFIKKDNTYQVKKEIREMVIFAPQNVIKDPPFIKLDLLSCRNLLIYLEAEIQKKLMPFFHYALNPGGLLFLGTSETIAEFTDLFSLIDKKWRVFIRRESAASTRRIVELPPMRSPQKSVPLPAPAEFKKEGIINIAQMAERIILEQFGPPCVVVNKEGDIIYIHGRTGNYLEPASGEASLNIFKMAREGLRGGLMRAFRQMIPKKGAVILEELEVKTNGSTQLVQVKIQPVGTQLENISDLVLVVFEDIPTKEKTVPDKIIKSSSTESDNYIVKLEKELRYTKEYLQGTIEEIETSNEELKSANEELQSTNEELQSTNEELETSQEELQSLNEENVTLNAELQCRIDSLQQANNDMKNLLESTEIATIFLNNDLCISRFTSKSNEIINLIPTDVGRPISDIVPKIKYETLAQDAQEVLKSLVYKEKEVQTQNGRWYLMRIRPYRTMENVIDGLVLTFVDIHEQRVELGKTHELKQSLQEARQYSQAIIDTMREALVVLDKNLRVITCNPSFYKIFHVKPDETEGQFIYDLGNKQWDIPRLRELLDKIIPQSTTIEDFDVEHNFQKIGHKKMLLNARRIDSEGKGTEMILLAIEDITNKKG